MGGVIGIVGRRKSDELEQVREFIPPSAQRAPTRPAQAITRGLSRTRVPPVRPVSKLPWAKRYVRVLAATDFLSGCFAGLIAYLVRMPDSAQVAEQTAAKFGPWLIAFPFLWVGTNALTNAFDQRIVGLGPEEFHRCARAFVALLAAIGFGSYALKAAVPRGVVVVALPLALVLSVGTRYAARKVLHRARSRGRASHKVVLIGDADTVADMSDRLRRDTYAGLRVVGACVPANKMSDARTIDVLARAKVPVLGDLNRVLQAVSTSGADTVAVTSSHAFGPQRLRELSWQMEQIEADMLVAPGLVEVAGPRLHIRPVTGLPLLHVEKPEFTGGKRVLKGVADRVASITLVILLAPLLAAIWLAVRLTSPGPGFFRQVRVGKDGKEFRMWKFRSMYADAEERLASFASLSDGNGVLFKMKNDPRVTRVGAFLRKWSLDELPQLFNVVNGTMSLVGPRPPLPSEVEKYGLDGLRRLLVRPGLTGLWQVSGRSDLTWEESIRLDLRYVENWSFTTDLLILWKTIWAVAKRSGAY
jgi:exopolysaccharide biosynthesis polyprenyl glycosylphosphotransferase